MGKCCVLFRVPGKLKRDMDLVFKFSLSFTQEITSGNGNKVAFRFDHYFEKFSF
jgi:hypothetical protein